MAAKGLRFAALIRVSTEKQEKQGESLRTQDKQLTQAVKMLGGTVVERYAGQEHATPGWVRQEFNRLLADAAKKHKPFDAVIVTEPSRWSRDHVVNDTALDHLLDHGVRFFTLTTEHDLNDPGARLYLTLFAVINAYIAKMTRKTSLENRIERAKRGIPTSGDLPYGRTFDKKTETWSIQKEDEDGRDPKATMRDIARRLLKGERMADLSKTYGISQPVLYNRLKKAGDKFPITFKTGETVAIPIPPLLDAKTLLALKRQMEANRTFHRGHSKNRYLLARMIFCAHCGSALSGQCQNEIRYYRHLPRHHSSYKGKGPCEFAGFVRADHLEGIVLRHLFATFGNPAAMRRAIEEAIPDREQVERDRDRLEQIERDVQSQTKARGKIIAKIADELLSDDEALPELNKRRDRIAALEAERDRITAALAQHPNRDTIKEVADNVSGWFGHLKGADRRIKQRRAMSFEEMTWDDQRALMEMLFSGKTPEGRRMGVLVQRTAKGSKEWQYTLHGHLIEGGGDVPPFELDPDDEGSFRVTDRQDALLKRNGAVTHSSPCPPR